MSDASLLYPRAGGERYALERALRDDRRIDDEFPDWMAERDSEHASRRRGRPRTTGGAR